MKIVHAADTGAGFALPRMQRRTAMLAILSLCVLAFIALAALAFPTLWPGNASKSPAATNGSWPIAEMRFDRLPGEDAGAIIERTSVGKEALEALSPDAAAAANARIPLVGDVGPAARPLLVPLGDGKAYIRALDCLSAAVYYEAANEPLDGQRAVAQVVLNRVRHAAYPKTVCGVVYQGAERKTGCQFSFTCDGSLMRTPSIAGWQRARAVAGAALAGLVYRPVGLATHYHADYVLPYWAPTLLKQLVINRHIFYRWPGQWGTPAAFTASYDSAEPDIWADRHLSPGDVPPGAEILALPGEAQPAIATMASRPVLSLSDGAAPAAAGTPTAATPVQAASGRKYLSSTAPAKPATAPATADRPRSMTGGVIMPGTHPAPAAAPARQPGEPAGTNP